MSAPRISRAHLLSLLLCLAFAACGGDAPDTDTAVDGGPEAASGAEAAVATITAEDLRAHVATLGSDEFGGRAPSSPGEQLTVDYLVEHFEALGLEPGNEGSWFQEVPLVAITADPATASFTVSGSGEPMAFDYGDDVVTWTTRVVESASVEDSEMVFVGYGIVAPEYGWDDYEGVDVTGKTVVILVNDPGYATQDPELFTGNAMTYYGRWTYKYEEAARQGAAAALVIHQTAPAAYGWSTVRNSWTGPQFNLRPEDDNMGRVAIEGWISEETTRALFDRAGLDLEALQEEALSPDFAAVDMGLALSASVDNTLEYSESRNVIGVLPGSEAPDEYFLYMGHWDHLGTDPALEAAGEDGIYNGAMDNASGMAALLELAEAFATLPERPRRSIAFLGVTAEEQGLLGSRHYAENPVFPLASTVAGLNMDGLNTYGPTREIVVTGYGMSELDGLMEEAAAAQDRRVDPDPEAEKGYYYRSDHFELAKVGVPMIYPDAGIDLVDGGVEAGRAHRQAYLDERYHMPTDELDESWDLSGAVQDVKLFFDVGLAVADSDMWPEWNEGSEFRAARQESLAGAGSGAGR